MATSQPRRKAAATSSTPAADNGFAAGEPTGRWAEVLAATRAANLDIKPFEITDDLVLYPPTPERARGMSRATAAAQAAVAASVNAVRNGASQAELDEISQQIEAADLEYTRDLVGPDKHDAVEAYFADKGQWERDAFIDAIRNQFLRLPEDGVCKHCGQVIDHDQAGKGNPSSNTSSTTGMNSRVTSEPALEESEPETGAPTDSPGTSSTTTAKPLPA
jgi:hypothetical protein